MTSPRAAPLAPEAPVLEPAELAPACIKLDLKDAPSGSANGLECRGSPPSSTTGTTLTSSVNGSCTSLPLSTELAAPSEDGSKSSDHMPLNDALEATRLPGYMEGFASGYARGRAAAMLENSSRRNPAVPDEMDPVDEVSFYASGERKRCRSACINCRETRIRCVMLRCGSCSGCVEQGIPCVQSVSKKRGPKEARVADKRNHNHPMLLLAQEAWQRSSEQDHSRQDGEAAAAAPGPSALAAAPPAAAAPAGLAPLTAAVSMTPSVQGLVPPAARHLGRQGQPDMAVFQMHLSHMLAMPGVYDGGGGLPASMSFAHAQQLRMPHGAPHGFTSSYQVYQNQMMQLQAYIQHQRHASAASAMHGHGSGPGSF